jgi:hypothetical protein
MNFDDFVNATAHITTLEKAHIIQSGGCSIRLSDQFDVHLEWEAESNAVCFYTDILLDSHKDDKAQLYALLLRTNLFGAATDGATFGLHKEQLYLFKKIHLSFLDELEFLDELQKFVILTQHWHTKLVSMAEEGSR